MPDSSSLKPVDIPPETLRRVLRDDTGSACEFLAAVLDAQILLGEDALATDDLRALWTLYCRDCSPEEPARKLGLVAENEAGTCSISANLNQEVAAEVERHLMDQCIRLPQAEMRLGDLLEDFDRYCRDELQIQSAETGERSLSWGGKCFTSAGRCHHVLVRPAPVRLQAHRDHFFLMLCQLPESGTEKIVEFFVKSSALRQRVALFDLERALKINLTRSDVFVHFERFLRRRYGIRLVPAPELTQGLVDGALMAIEKG
jgi:hypothetical protein